MSGSTVPEERARAATRRIEFDQVLLFGDEQSELRESASGTPETAPDLTWGGEQLYVNVTKQVGKTAGHLLLSFNGGSQLLSFAFGCWSVKMKHVIHMQEKVM